ncbi:MAG TPA: glycine--tRNA ligase [Candidatus Paceibacterota bacterium]|nr:glycine--tRNA ligase [Candidatus Paceibacterota bacterium]
MNPGDGNLMDKIVSLAKRRGFVFPGSEIYGGLANSWDYGPLGVELKNNIKAAWWSHFVHRREDMVGLDSAVIMSPKVWQASGHTGTGFADPLVECKNCHERFRADQIDLSAPCPNCGMSHTFTEPRSFNILMKTFLGAVEGEKAEAYLRGETAQGIFIDFKSIVDVARKPLPFGVAQIGKAFRNEITPGNFIFRTREFEQMEIEYFIPVPVRDEDWAEPFDYWRREIVSWLDGIGIAREKIHEDDIPDGERAHYSKRTIDFEFDYPFGRKELCGLAYRTDFDLKNHFKDAPYKDPQTAEAFWPHVIEPSLGVDRTMLALLVASYAEDGDRAMLKLKPRVAPFKAAVFPLLSNKPHLVEKARSVYDALRRRHMVAWDDRGNIGKRYYAQDEIGTPFCITVDFDTLGEGDAANKDTVTVRDRDNATQTRLPIKELASFIERSLEADTE